MNSINGFTVPTFTVSIGKRAATNKIPAKKIAKKVTPPMKKPLKKTLIKSTGKPILKKPVKKALIKSTGKPNLKKPVKKPIATKKPTPQKKKPFQKKSIVSKPLKPKGPAPVVNLVQFGYQVINSPQGKEAISVLLGGGIKMVQAILEEGKKTKVELPQGFDSGGNLRQKNTFVGFKELADGGIFAAQELFDAVPKVYSKVYTFQEKTGGAVRQIPSYKNLKTGKVIPKKEVYYYGVGLNRIKVVKDVK